MKQLQEKAILFVLSYLFGHSLLPAQTQHGAADAVHLKSGEVYRGIIVEQRPGESIRLWRLVEADTLTFDMESIDRITKVVTQALPDARKDIPLENTQIFNNRRWMTAIFMSAGGGDNSAGGLGVMVLHHIPKLRSWLGFGAHYLGDTNGYGTSAIPIFLHGNHEFAQLWKKRCSSGVFWDAGYSVNLGGKYFDTGTLQELRYGNGFHSYGGFRFRINILKNAGITADLGYLRHSSQLRNAATDAKVRNKTWHLFLFRGSVFF